MTKVLVNASDYYLLFLEKNNSEKISICSKYCYCRDCTQGPYDKANIINSELPNELIYSDSKE